jgi:aspartokinase/homoserine dehydrogenase 2
MVGAGVTRNPLHCHRFWQQLKGQPVEFTWQSEEGISLVAVLRAGPTESLIQGLHQSLFRAEKRIGLVLFGKGNIGSRWLELFAREQARFRRVPGLNLFSRAWWTVAAAC